MDLIGDIIHLTNWEERRESIYHLSKGSRMVKC